MRIDIPKNVPWTSGRWAVIIICVVVIIGIYIVNTGEKEDSTPKIYHTLGKYFVAPTEEIFEKAQEYKLAKDLGAIEELINAGMITFLPSYTAVYIVRNKYGLVKIRIKGTTQELWTYKEELYEKLYEK